MANNVFAEGMGFFHKNSNGRGTAPGDICLTPPPNAPQPIAYVNNLFAKDLTNGSKSVKIHRAPTALENKSEIAISTGDEPGTQGGNIVTHKTKGKGVFMRWSNNVKAEGKGVCCHGDLMGQNNAAKTPNGATDFSAQVNKKKSTDKEKENMNCKGDNC